MISDLLRAEFEQEAKRTLGGTARFLGLKALNYNRS